MRTQLIRIVLFFALLGLMSCNSATRDSAESPQGTIIFQADHILTIDSDNRIVTAMAIQDEKILAIGEIDELTSLYHDAELIKLEGKTIMPGVIDSHVHVRELGMDQIKADLVGVQTVDDMIARIKQKFPSRKAGEWLIGQGWDEGAFASRGYPDRELLDQAFPNNPVALEMAGVDAQSPDPEGGTILKRDNGEPSGVMLVLAQGLVTQHIPPPDQAVTEQAILAGLNEMAKAGVTSIHEAGMTPLDVAAFEALAARGELPIRVYGMLDGNNKNLMTDWFARGYRDDPDDWLDIRGIKVFYDGSLGSRTAMMKAPYSDKPEEAKPTARIHLHDIDKLAVQAVETGFQMAVHAIGDEGNDCVIASYELRLSDRSDLDHRWRVEHAQVVLPNYYDRAAALGVLSSMQSSNAVGDSQWAEDRIGSERIKHAYAWQRILAAGGRVMMNSDLPGEPWHPMETLYFAVTRKRLDGTPSNGWYADQALSTEQALRSMTIENAYGAFQDDRLGSLEVGKWSDFIVLSDNPHEVDAGALKDIKVEQVWVAGHRLH